MRNNIEFTKMHGTGNDFIVMNYLKSKFDLDKEKLKKISDRRFGIGADQILILEKTNILDVHFKYRIFNSDGEEVEQCGNGARCFLKFLLHKNLIYTNDVKVETLGGIINLVLESNGNVKVNMGFPNFEKEAIYFDSSGLKSKMIGDTRVWFFELNESIIEISVVSVGNPHAVILVNKFVDKEILDLGKKIESHPRFKKKVNVGFMQVLNNSNLKLRVYERGVGETLSCGTGACAAAVTGIRMNLLSSPVKVFTRGGELSIVWNGTGNSIIKSGPAEIVFEGSIAI